MRLYLLGLLACGIALPHLSGAPKLKGDDRVYLPTTPGDTWTMEVTTDGKVTREQSYVVTTVESKEGDLNVTIWRERTEPPRGRVQSDPKTYGVSEKGILQLSYENRVFDTPVCQLRTPAKPGDSWECDIPVGDDKYKKRFTIAKEEDVEVPAGKFSL